MAQYTTGYHSSGGKLIIQYDPERLPLCRTHFPGALFGEIEVYITFNPGGQFYIGSVLDKVRSDGDYGVVIELVPKEFAVIVPGNASAVELWFRGFYQTTSTCEEWDSRYGKNYWYPVVSP